MISSSTLRRTLTIAACVTALGLVPGCGDDMKSSTPATPPTPATPAATPAPVSKAAPITNPNNTSSSNAAQDSTQNPK